MLKDPNEWKDTHVHRLEDLILSRWQYTQANLHIQHNSYQIPKHLPHRNQKDDPKKKYGSARDPE